MMLLLGFHNIIIVAWILMLYMHGSLSISSGLLKSSCQCFNAVKPKIKVMASYSYSTSIKEEARGNAIAHPLIEG